MFNLPFDLSCINILLINALLIFSFVMGLLSLLCFREICCIFVVLLRFCTYHKLSPTCKEICITPISVCLCILELLETALVYNEMLMTKFKHH